MEFENSRDTNLKTIKNITDKLKEQKIQYAVFDHKGTSPYIDIVFTDNLPNSKDIYDMKKFYAQSLIPSKDVILDLTNIGKTPSPVPFHPHWKKKYNGNIHMFIEGILPIDQKNSFPDNIKQEIKKKKVCFRDISRKRDSINLSFDKLMLNEPRLQGLDETTNGYQGEHPNHPDSQNGCNLNITIDEGWYCHRCNAGGDVLKLIAVINNVIECADELRGDDFREARTIAHDKYGYTEKELEIEEQEEQEYFEPKTLKDVHNVFDKWLYLRDYKFLHTAMAITLSSQGRGPPIWMVFIGPSSDSKSETLRSIAKCRPCDLLLYKDEITAKTLVSGARIGKKPVKDLGSVLNHKISLVVTPDMASLTAADKGEKKIIYAKFRELWDGFLQKDTGNGVSRDYNDIQCTWMFGAVPSVRNEILIQQQIGTRELLFVIPSFEEDDDKKMDMAWNHEEQHVTMKDELQGTVAGYMQDKKYNKMTPVPEAMKRKIQQEAKSIEQMRATGPTDKRTGQLLSDVNKAKAMRSMLQLKKLYKAFKSMDSEYFTDEYIYEIIKLIRNSCADPIRMKIYDKAKNNPDRWYASEELADMQRVSKNAIERQAFTLTNMRMFDHMEEYVQRGSITRSNKDGDTWTTGGRTVTIHKFRYNGEGGQIEPTLEQVRMPPLNVDDPFSEITQGLDTPFLKQADVMSEIVESGITDEMELKNKLNPKFGDFFIDRCFQDEILFHRKNGKVGLRR